MQKITPFLWFDNNAEEAMNFYCSVFEDSEVLSISRFNEAGPGPVGDVMVVKFKLQGVEFLAMNGGPAFKFNEAISLTVDCKNQEEVDYYWEKLLEGGVSQACGWLKDKYGLSWQITPTILPEMLLDEDKQKAKRVMEAMMTMVKIDIPTLQKAYDG